MNKKLLAIVFATFLLGGSLAMPVSAFAKTVYVDEDGDDGDDGSSDHPYKTLEAAAEEVNEGDADEVKIGKGSFSDSVTFDQGVSIEGEGKGSTTLTGTLTFKKKVNIKDLSIRTKAKNAVIIGKSSSATVKNVDIRDYAGIGIWVMSGSGELTIEDSRIGGGGGKGVYAEAGTKLNVYNSTIINNKQEGLDIRQNTRGTIKNNVIENNSESGIELIVGSSDFVISGNDVKRNGASGIAFQFYEIKKKLGTITATGNTVSGNHKFGIDCNKPQSGDTPAGYWADSITLDANSFGNNKITDVSTSCKLIEAKTEEEEKQLEEQIKVEEKVEAVVEPATDADPAAQEKLAQETASAESLVGQIESVGTDEQYQAILKTLQDKKNFLVTFRGWNYATLEPLRTALENDQNTILTYKASLSELSVYATRSDLQERVLSKEIKLEEYQNTLAHYQENKGWFQYVSSDLFAYVNKFFYVFLF